MKKTRKLLSMVLAVLVVFASMPVVYTGTAAADAVTYAAAQTGTIDNPTKPVSQSGEYNQNETNHLTAIHKNVEFVYYQTMNDEYFQLSQVVQMEKYCGTTDSITVMINGYGFNTDAATNAFFNTRGGTYTWTAGTDESAETAFPNAFEAEGTVLSCPDYSWNLDVVFKGNSANASGEVNTGYTHMLDYTTTVSDVATNYQTPVTTTIKILDARELVEKMAEAENVIANSENYTDAYVSSVQATLNSIPEDLKDFSRVYDQSVIDGYIEDLETVSLNSANYTEYNELYSQLKAMDNSKGAYATDSFAAFKAEIDSINSNLSKTLDKTQQATVDAATQALKDAFELLVSTDLSESNAGFTYTSNGDDGDMYFTVDNTAFKFMQTKDNQVFEYSQMWTIERDGGSTARNFGGMILQTSALSDACGNSTCRSNQTPAANNTQAFVDRLTSDSYATITARNEIGVINDADTTFTAPEFLCWTEHTDATGTTSKDTTIIDTSGSYIGSLDSNRDYQYDDGSTYYLKNSPKFTGNPAGTYGEISANYVLRTGWSYTTGGIFGWLGTKHSSHIHVNSTIQVTDVRQLISAVEEAKETLANPGTHSEEYITALQAAVDSVPMEMLKGVEYYTQAEVDKLYSDITGIPEQVADYSEFVEVFKMMTSLNKDKYTEDSYNTFVDEIYAVNQGLAKNLTVDQQATVNEAVDALYAAYDKLVSAHLNDDTVFTQDDINGELGNNPLEFSLATTQYNFMQIADGQKFALRTDLTVRNTKTNYNLYLRGLGFSVVTPDALAAYCTSDDHCHNISDITLNQTEIVAGAVSGVNALTYTDGVVAADAAGNITEHNTWVNTEGTALSSGGILIDNVELSNSDSSAHSEIYYVGASGDVGATVDATYALWLGWYYVEPFLGSEANSDELYRHVHIPVNVKITDARALNSLYGEVEDVVNGNTETTYTLESLLNLYNAYTATDEDMANGNVYHTQEEVNAEYAELKAAYDALEEGADYSEYFEAYVKAQEIIATGNDDGYGNKLYDEETYNAFKETVESVDSALDKNLADTEENQAIIDAATGTLNNALATLEATKYADYTALEEAIAEAEKILNASDGTYTNETLDVLKEALKNANALDRELPVSEQATVDAVTSALEAAIADMEFRADYSEFDEAYSQVKDIVDNPDKYTSETVEAAKDAIEEADKLSKDLPDTAENRATIENAVNELNKVLDSAVERADYTDYNNAKYEADNLVNDDGNGNAIYDEDAFNAYKEEVNKVDTELSKDLPASEQQTVTDAVSALEDLKATLEENKKADYTEFDAAKEALENIVNNPDNYTSDSVKAAQDALDAANQVPEDMVVGENNINQDTIDSATDSMNEVLGTIEEKADYTEFDKVVEELENIVNNPDDYTDETVQAAKDALEDAGNLDKDLPLTEQGTVDEATSNLQDVVNSAEERADYTDYNAAKDAADELVNDDGNGNPIYDEEAFQQYKDAVEEADKTLDKNLPASEQTKVDDATQALEDLKATLEESRIATPTVIDPETTVEDILKDYNADEVIIEIKDYTGKELTSVDFVGTGSTMRVTLKSTGEVLEYKMFIVMGDVDGDGDVDADDYNTSKLVGLEMYTYAEEHNYFFVANDMDADGVIDVIDTALIRRMY